MKRELRISALSAQVRAEEVQRVASRAAAHRVSNCFNTLLTATVQMQRSMTEVQQEKLVTCCAVVVECRENFIALQKDLYISNETKHDFAVDVGVKQRQGEEEQQLQSLHSRPQQAAATQGQGLCINGINLTSSSNQQDDQNNTEATFDIGIDTTVKRPSMRVCVIDDNEFCREFIMYKISELLGEKSQVDGVGTSAQTALAYLMDKMGASTYDLVLVDLSMPMDMDNIKGQNENERAGLWVVSQYKARRPQSETKFLCLSGMGQDPISIARCKDAGFIPPYALGKPIEWNVIGNILKTF